MKNLNCEHDVGTFNNYCGECGNPVELEKCECGVEKTGKPFCTECGKAQK